MPSLHQYRPHRTAPESLEAITTAREPFVEEMLDRLRSHEKGGSRQHFLFIGPRGIGKTHILQLFRHRIARTPSLSDRWETIPFAEDSYGMTRASDLLLEALRILSKNVDSEFLKSAYMKIQFEDNDARVVDISLDAFREFHRKTGRSIVFLIENIDRVFERQMKKKAEVQMLRKILIEEEWAVAVCTSPTYLAAVTEESEPFFEFFQVRVLPELTMEQQLDMLEKLSEHEGNENFKRYFETYKPRLKAMYHFTGGNPRLSMLLYDLVSYGAVGEIHAELDRLLDKITPFYQDRMKDMGEQGAKLVETMSLMPESLTPGELAKHARMSPAVVRAQIMRLERAGYVRREQRRNKRTVYIIPERLFRIWHQMNHSRSARGLVQYLLEFFNTWYETRKERDEAWGEITEGLREKIDNDERDGFENDLQYLDYLIESSEGDEQIEREFDRLCRLGECSLVDVGRELARLDQLYGNRSEYFRAKGTYLAKSVMDLNAALQAYEEALLICPDDTVALFNKGIVLQVSGRTDESVLVFERIFSRCNEGEEDFKEKLSRDLLLSLLEKENNRAILMAVRFVVGKYGTNQIVPDIVEIVKGATDGFRLGVCLRILGDLDRKTAVIHAIELIEHQDEGIRFGATSALIEIHTPKAMQPLLKALHDPSRRVRGSAATALGRIGSPEAMVPLIAALNDPAARVRGSAATSLGLIGSVDAVEPLINSLNDSSGHIRANAVDALGKIATDRSMEALFDQLSSEKVKSMKQKIRKAITEAIAVRTEKKMPSLIQKLADLPGEKPENAVTILQNALRILLARQNLTAFKNLLRSIRKNVDLPLAAFLPYKIFSNYISAERDPFILERQHPEMRDAVNMLVKLYDSDQRIGGDKERRQRRSNANEEKELRSGDSICL